MRDLSLLVTRARHAVSRSARLINVTLVTTMLLMPFMAGEANAALSGNYTNTGAATATFKGSATNGLVLDVTIPDAWNGTAFTADTIVKAGSAAIWQGDALTSFTALGSTSGVGYKEDGTAGFQGTEAVVRDLDKDSVYTSAADVLVDGDGSATTGAGTMSGSVTVGGVLVGMTGNAATGNNAVCTDSVTAPTTLRISTTPNCSASAGTYVLGTNATTTSVKVATGQFAFADAVSMGGNGNGTYDDGEDVFRDGRAVAGLTYSGSADTDVYSTGGLTNGDAIISFLADCDGAGSATQACKFTGSSPIASTASILIDNGTAGGAAANSVVDKQADQLIGLGVQNTGTAVNSTDISAVKVWTESGANAGFQSAQDTLLGSMTVNSGNNKEWRLGSLTTAIPNGGVRMYVTVDTAVAATNGATFIFQIPVLNDAGANGVVSADNDRGVFVSSTNDGPTNAVVLNANTQTLDTVAPTLAEVTPVATPDTDTTPNYTFSSTEAGSITYGGDCSSATSSAAAGNNTVTFNALSAATHSNCTVQVTDAAGNISTTLNVSSFTITAADVTAPTIAEVTPVPATTTDTTPDYTFSSDEAGTISYGGSCSSATTSAVVGNNTVTFNTLADGTYNNCTIQVTDGSANASTVLNVSTFAVDTTAPTAAEVTAVPSLTNDNTPSYTFSSTEAGTISYGGDCSSATGNAVVGNNVIVFNSLADGSHSNCTVQVTDAIGNAGNVVNVSAFTVDTVGATLTEFAPIASPINDSTPDYTFVSDDAGSITYGGDCSSATTTAVAGNNTITFNALSEAAHSNCTIQITDAASNASNLLAVSTFTVDTTAPTLAEITAVTTPTANNTPSYTFSSTEAGTIAYSGDCSSATTVASSGNNTVNFNALADGSHSNCTVQVTDDAGNASATLNVSSFTVDTTAPVIAEVTPVATPNGDNTPTYTFSTDEDGTISYVGDCSSAATNATAGNNTVTFNTLADGSHSNCTVQVTDNVGNASTTLSVTTFTIDTTAPTIAEVTPVPTPDVDTTPSYTFSSDEAGAITYGGDCGSATANAVVGNNAVTFSLLALGAHSNCTVQVTDASGNASSVLNVTAFTINAPTISSRNSFSYDPRIGIEVTASLPPVGPVTLNYAVPNKGSAILSNIRLTDDHCSDISYVGGDTNNSGLLDLTETWNYTCRVALPLGITQSVVNVSSQYNGAAVTNSAQVTITVEEQAIQCQSVSSSGVNACEVPATQQGPAQGTTPGDTTQNPAQGTTPTANPFEKLGLKSHDLVKNAMNPAVFYLGPDGKKHLFVNQGVFLSWYKDFSDVKVVPLASLASIPQGANVTYRPGVKMLKLANNPKVYAVDNSNILRWITGPAVAEALYGADWTTKIDDITNFDGYVMGDDIASADGFKPSLARITAATPSDCL